jgi:hypothetical protein
VQFDVDTITRHAWTKEFLSFVLDSDVTLTRQIKEDSGLIEALEPRNLTPDKGHLFAMSMVVTKRLNESKTPQQCVVCGGLDYEAVAIPLRTATYMCHGCWGVSLVTASKFALTAANGTDILNIVKFSPCAQANCRHRSSEVISVLIDQSLT